MACYPCSCRHLCRNFASGLDIDSISVTLVMPHSAMSRVTGEATSMTACCDHGVYLWRAWD
jgi:hypothetical protein